MKFVSHKAFRYLLISTALFLLYFLVFNFQNSKDPLEKNTLKIQSVLNEKEQKALALIEEMSRFTVPDSLFLLNFNKDNNLSNKGLFLFIKCSSEILYWSDNLVPLEQQMKANSSPCILKLQNGWYEYLAQQKGELVYIALILIKYEYNYQNKYLKNEFHPDFNINNRDRFELDLNPKGNSVVSSINERFLFSLQNNTGRHPASRYSWLLILSSLTAIFFALLSAYHLLIHKKAKYRNAFNVIGFITLLIVVRTAMMYFGFPSVLYETSLFSPVHYASSHLLPSLGDYVLNVMVLFCIILVYRYSSYESKRSYPYGVALSLISSVLFLFILIEKTIEILIKDSNIPLDITDVFSLNGYSYGVLFIIGLMCAGFGIYAYETSRRLFTINNHFSYFIKFIVPAVLIVTGMMYLVQYENYFALFFAASLFACMTYLTANKRVLSSGYLFVFLVMISIFGTVSISRYLNEKEINTRKVLADKLAEEQDPIAENLFESLNRKLASDTSFAAIVKQPEKFKEDLNRLLTQKYFNGYWEKYNLTSYLFDNSGESVIEKNLMNTKDISNLEVLINEQGRPTFKPNLYFIDDPSRLLYYMIRMPVYDKRNDTLKTGTLYIELDAKFIADEIGFPGLLLDKNFEEGSPRAKYSYARFTKGKLITHYGNYSYPISSSFFDKHYGEEEFVQHEGYTHYILKRSNENLFVLSLPQKNLFGYITTFSYLLAFFGVLLILFALVYRLEINKLEFKSSFRTKIQAQLILLLVFSMIIFAYGTIVTIKEQYRKKNMELISEKIHSVLIDLEQLLGAESDLGKVSQEYLSYNLSKMANIFYTDINLYDLNGRIIASSRSKLFEQGLVSNRMNSDAYGMLKIKEKTEFIHDEKIGNLNYLSAYIPFENNENKLLAFINLPSFAKQDELEKEISVFLVTIINIYLLLFVITAFTAIVISNRITYPLKLIQEKIRHIELGKRNEMIEWKEQDEIGNLVREYNRMIVELANSAELLIRSEREGAWREMAKQVAHEIKNPLTPMKLSVQYLQRAMQDKAPDWDKKFDKTAKTLIEQIDTLSTIANEFSNFAKLPQPTYDLIDLVPVITQVIDLFKNESANITFNTSLHEAIVKSDKDHLIRILNNLIKNSIQAIPEDRRGLIELELKKEGHFFLISVKDNGTGIPEEQKEKMFVPNFTTKSTGTGLGLAMVKSMVEQSNGKIWYETEKNIGTVFYISLPQPK